jgi:hypothetical protein
MDGGVVSDANDVVVIDGADNDNPLDGIDDGGGDERRDKGVVGAPPPPPPEDTADVLVDPPPPAPLLVNIMDDCEPIVIPYRSFTS